MESLSTMEWNSMQDDATATPCDSDDLNSSTFSPRSSSTSSSTPTMTTITVDTSTSHFKSTPVVRHPLPLGTRKRRQTSTTLPPHQAPRDDDFYTLTIDAPTPRHAPPHDNTSTIQNTTPTPISDGGETPKTAIDSGAVLPREEHILLDLEQQAGSVAHANITTLSSQQQEHTPESLVWTLQDDMVVVNGKPTDVVHVLLTSLYTMCPPPVVSLFRDKPWSQVCNLTHYDMMLAILRGQYGDAYEMPTDPFLSEHGRLTEFGPMSRLEMAWRLCNLPPSGAVVILFRHHDETVLADHIDRAQIKDALHSVSANRRRHNDHAYFNHHPIMSTAATQQHPICSAHIRLVSSEFCDNNGGAETLSSSATTPVEIAWRWQCERSFAFNASTHNNVQKANVKLGRFVNQNVTGTFLPWCALDMQLVKAPVNLLYLHGRASSSSTKSSASRKRVSSMSDDTFKSNVGTAAAATASADDDFNNDDDTTTNTSVSTPVGDDEESDLGGNDVDIHNHTSATTATTQHHTSSTQTMTTNSPSLPPLPPFVRTHVSEVIHRVSVRMALFTTPDEISNWLLRTSPSSCVNIASICAGKEENENEMSASPSHRPSLLDAMVTHIVNGNLNTPCIAPEDPNNILAHTLVLESSSLPSSVDTTTTTPVHHRVARDTLSCGNYPFANQKVGRKSIRACMSELQAFFIGLLQQQQVHHDSGRSTTATSAYERCLHANNRLRLKIIKRTVARWMNAWCSSPYEWMHASWVPMPLRYLLRRRIALEAASVWECICTRWIAIVQEHELAYKGEDSHLQPSMATLFDKWLDGEAMLTDDAFTKAMTTWCNIQHANHATQFSIRVAGALFNERVLGSWLHARGDEMNNTSSASSSSRLNQPVFFNVNNGNDGDVRWQHAFYSARTHWLDDADNGDDASVVQRHDHFALLAQLRRQSFMASIAYYEACERRRVKVLPRTLFKDYVGTCMKKHQQQQQQQEADRDNAPISSLTIMAPLSSTVDANNGGNILSLADDDVSFLRSAQPQSLGDVKMTTTTTTTSVETPASSASTSALHKSAIALDDAQRWVTPEWLRAFGDKTKYHAPTVELVTTRTSSRASNITRHATPSSANTALNAADWRSLHGTHMWWFLFANKPIRVFILSPKHVLARHNKQQQQHQMTMGTADDVSAPNCSSKEDDTMTLESHVTVSSSQHESSIVNRNVLDLRNPTQLPSWIRVRVSSSPPICNISPSASSHLANERDMLKQKRLATNGLLSSTRGNKERSQQHNSSLSMPPAKRRKLSVSADWGEVDRHASSFADSADMHTPVRQQRRARKPATAAAAVIKSSVSSPNLVVDGDATTPSTMMPTYHPPPASWSWFDDVEVAMDDTVRRMTLEDDLSRAYVDNNNASSKQKSRKPRTTQSSSSLAKSEAPRRVPVATTMPGKRLNRLASRWFATHRPILSSSSSSFIKVVNRDDENNDDNDNDDDDALQHSPSSSSSSTITNGGDQHHMAVETSSSHECEDETTSPSFILLSDDDDDVVTSRRHRPRWLSHSQLIWSPHRRHRHQLQRAPRLVGSGGLQLVSRSSQRLISPSEEERDVMYHEEDPSKWFASSSLAHPTTEGDVLPSASTTHSHFFQLTQSTNDALMATSVSVPSRELQQQQQHPFSRNHVDENALRKSVAVCHFKSFKSTEVSPPLTQPTHLLPRTDIRAWFPKRTSHASSIVFDLRQQPSTKNADDHSTLPFTEPQQVDVFLSLPSTASDAVVMDCDMIPDLSTTMTTETQHIGATHHQQQHLTIEEAETTTTPTAINAIAPMHLQLIPPQGDDEDGILYPTHDFLSQELSYTTWSQSDFISQASQDGLDWSSLV